MLREVSDMDTKKVNYKWEIPPDCITPDDDEYEYVPHCPVCDEILEEFPLVDCCRKCGQRLDWENPNYPKLHY